MTMLAIINKLFEVKYIIYEVGKLCKSDFSVLPFFFLFFL